ncbi:hypothetical protein LVJ94_29810 [Pendulispora rubella]|uniref:Glutamine amidotransferase domain-containing protein n=1 Tax=Pendulispora rubella TaxID=2741070 RepID=A0ABZ2KR20_9BACT
MHIHFVIHESFEGPGAFETWIRNRDYTASYSRVHTHEPLPQSVEGIDLLVVLGGPQSASTTKEECPHFDAGAERALIVKCISAKKAVLGVCLGSQLLGEALGAKHERSPQKEIGTFPITLTAEGKASDKFAHFPHSLDVGHWHDDMPGLTKDAKVLAYSEACPRQIIEYGNLVYGFQCHMEFTKDVIELLIAHSEDELAESSGFRFVQRPDELRAGHYGTMNETLFVFLDKLVTAYQSQK